MIIFVEKARLLANYTSTKHWDKYLFNRKVGLERFRRETLLEFNEKRR